MNQRAIRYVLWGLCGFMLVALLAQRLLLPKIRATSGKAAAAKSQSFGSVPDFTLTERSGRPLGLVDLRGKVWVANFMYTACRDTCPLQSAEMAKLQSDINGKSGLRLVSISIDPEHDTPEVLARYAERFHADPKLWFFLTGDRNKIYQLAQQGFHLSAVPLAQEGSQPSDGFIHSSRFVLVDGEAVIRGYYDSSDAAALSRLRKDLTTLLEEYRQLYG